MIKKSSLISGHNTLINSIFLLALMTGCQSQKTMNFKDTSGNDIALNYSVYENFKESIEGRILEKTDFDYESGRKFWNQARHDLKPAIIIKCINSTDIVNSVNFVRQNDLLFSVKGGGHNSSAFSMNDNGVVIDLSMMKKIKINTEEKTIVAEPGLTWGEFDNATQKHGLATTGAIVSKVGIGGFTLGGGLGWLHRSLGTASDNLIKIEIVTSSGEILAASENENSDLFWAIRGGGGNFGIITSFEYQLSDVGPELLAGLVFYDLSDAKEIVGFYNNYLNDIPNELGTWLLFRKAPASPSIPDSVHGKPVIILSITYNGSIDDAEKWVQPLRSIKKPIIDLVKVRTYVEWQSSLDGAWGDSFHNIWKGHYFMDLNEQILDTLMYYVPLGSKYSDIKIQHLEGQIGNKPEDYSAFGNRKSRFGLVIQTRWKDDANTKTQEQWTESVFEGLKPFGTGKVYVNFMDNEGEQRVADAYNNRSFNKLQMIKKKYDHDNLFRSNQNIKPSN